MADWNGRCAPVAYELLEHVFNTRTFLNDPDQYLRHLQGLFLNWEQKTPARLFGGRFLFITRCQLLIHLVLKQNWQIGFTGSSP